MNDDKEDKELAEMAKSVLRGNFNHNARRQVANLMLEGNLKRVRAKLGEVETTLTVETGHAEGVGSHSVKEIMYVYGIDRSTAYRWKKFNCHPWLEPELDSSKRIRWTDLPKDETKPTWQRRPYNPRLKAIALARSAVRCAINKLKKLDADPRYNRFPLDAECEKAAEETRDAAHELDHLVYFARHPDPDDDEY